MGKHFEMTDEQLDAYCEKLNLIVKIKKRCEYHELNFDGEHTPVEGSRFKIVITDDKFFSIYAVFNDETFDYNIKNINAFLDARILKEQKQ